MTPTSAAETERVLAELPLFALMEEPVRRLVADAFERVAYPFGTVVVREGEVADAFFVLVAGTARVLKQGAGGEEVPLNVLKPGDAFGEIALLEDSARTATVRASGDVEALRLDRSVFRALVHTNPAVREAFELSVRQRHLWNFFRLYTAFEHLPGDGLALLLRGLTRVDAAKGEIVIRQGDPPGPLYVVEEGRLRAYADAEDGRRDHAYYRKGDFFGETSLLRHRPRAATIEAVSDATLLELTPELYRELLETYPEFRTKIEERVAQYEYKRLARVPLDFAEELLPAEVGARERTEAAPEQAAVGAPEDLEAFAGEDGAPAQPRLPRRFPHVYQVDEMDCGAACVAMVTRAFGHPVSLVAIRDAVGTGLDGTSLMGIARGAERVGLASRAVKASKTHLDELPLPAVVHWEGNHWVVLYAVEDGHVRIADPARGRVRLAREEFDEKWSGYAALLSYAPALEDAPLARTDIRWLAPFFRPFQRSLAVAFGLAFLAAGLQLMIPIFTQVVVDDAIPDSDTGLVTLVLLGLGAVFVLMIAATLVQRYLLAKVAVRIDTATLDYLTGRLLALPMSYFNTRRTGDIERRLAGIRQVRSFVVQSGVLALTAVTQLIAAVALMFVYSWTLALVFLATVPVYALLMRFSSTRLRPMFDSLEEAYGRYASHQIDAIKGIETVKALAAEDALRRLMLARFTSLADRLFRAEFLIMAYTGAIQLVTFVSLALFLFAGARQVIAGSLSIGEFVSFSALVALSNGPIVLLLSLWDEVQLSRILLDRLNDVLEQEAEQGDREGLVPVRALEGRLRLANVGFRYGGPDAPPILDGISLDVPPGTSVAIVGRSGSGKTTLVKCLAGLLEPTEGAVLYDGHELRTLDYRTLRRQIGFVLQENHLFDDTIARNIAFGEEEPDMERVRAAARLAAAHGFVERLPLGYETRVGESGLKLSGGQQQRIAIARAVYHRPPVLLFDEATSSLDTESERAVKENVDELLEGRTSFVIAHRLSTIRDADLIVVLERGRLVEQGTNDELMERRGLYYYLLSQQLDV
jgi:HlyB family type I secretion system ABC transporter